MKQQWHVKDRLLREQRYLSHTLHRFRMFIALACRALAAPARKGLRATYFCIGECG
jgi:hypothetical protein